jgi:hypothetical protein
VRETAGQKKFAPPVSTYPDCSETLEVVTQSSNQRQGVEQADPTRTVLATLILMAAIRYTVLWSAAIVLICHKNNQVFGLWQYHALPGGEYFWCW